MAQCLTVFNRVVQQVGEQSSGSEQGFNQDFRIGCPKIHIWGELSNSFSSHCIIYTKNFDIRESKTPLVKVSWVRALIT